MKYPDSSDSVLTLLAAGCRMKAAFYFRNNDIFYEAEHRLMAKTLYEHKL